MTQGPASELVTAARRIYHRGLVHGSTGNLSIRTDDGFLISGSGTRFETVDENQLASMTLDNTHLSGPRPSKEAFLHAAVLAARPQDRVVVHTHSLYATALSCLDDLDPDDAIPAITPYFVMRARRVIALPYHAPGDAALGRHVTEAAQSTNALLLRRHGPVISAPDFDTAIDIVEELEHTCALVLLLANHRVTPLTAAQRSALHTAFPQ